MRHGRLVLALAIVLLASGTAAALLPPYLEAAAFIARIGHVGGAAESWAMRYASPVRVEGRHQIPTRHGVVQAQSYQPDGETRRTVLLIPGIHSMGIAEPRLTGLARDLAASGLHVVAMALPDLQRYRITPDSTDVIEDAVTWLAGQPAFAPDGRVGLVGISFAGGLSISAASRPAIADDVAFVVSFGGHGDLPRVMRYLTTGEAPRVDGFVARPPHDYGVAVILYGLADRGVVPSEQVTALRAGVETFLLASQLTLVDRGRADAMFARARDLADTMPEPSRTYMRYVNDRATGQLGPVLEPFLEQMRTEQPALSPARATTWPTCPVFLLHGQDDTVIPAVETSLLGARLRDRGTPTRILLSALITHAELNDAVTARDAWDLIAFWADILSR